MRSARCTPSWNRSDGCPGTSFLQNKNIFYKTNSFTKQTPFKKQIPFLQNKHLFHKASGGGGCCWWCWCWCSHPFPTQPPIHPSTHPPTHRPATHSPPIHHNQPPLNPPPLPPPAQPLVANGCSIGPMRARTHAHWWIVDMAMPTVTAPGIHGNLRVLPVISETPKTRNPLNFPVNQGWQPRHLERLCHERITVKADTGSVTYDSAMHLEGFIFIAQSSS